MLNLISSSFVWTGSWEFYLIVAAIAAIAVSGVVVFALKAKTSRNYVKPFFFTSLGLLGACLLTALISGVVVAVKDNIEGGAVFSPYVIAGILIAVLGVILLICLVDRKKGRNNNTVALVYAAICIAMSFALSYIRFFRMPQGGSITLASLLPIAIYSYVFGVRRGIVCCFIYGLLQIIQDPYLTHPIQVILDYPFAFMFIGMTGVFKKIIKIPQISISLGLIIGLAVRFLCHLVSGAVFFGDYAVENGLNPWLYSAGYNSFVAIDGLIVMVSAVMITSSKNILREFKRIENKYMPKIGVQSVTTEPNNTDI